MEAVATVKYVIIGSALSGNKGAAAMLESSIQTLSARDSRASFTLLSLYPEEDRRLNTYENLKILKTAPFYLGVVFNTLALKWRLFPFLRKFIEKSSPQIKALAEADVLLDQGGIAFVDGREKFLIYNVASILPALMTGTKVVKCAQALGPFNNPINRRVSKIFLPRMARIFSRGAITHEYLMSLNLENVTASADYAFALDVTDEERSSAQEKVDIGLFDGKNEVVGVSPSVVMRKKVETLGKDYVGIMVEFVDYLIEKGHEVVLIPHSVRMNTDKTHNNDLPLCREIYQKIEKSEQCLFIDQELSSQELRYIIGECDLFIASRFHAMVSSLAMGVPTLVVGWSHKYEEVLAMFELEEWAFGHDILSIDYLKERFKELENSQERVRELIIKHLPGVKKQAHLQAKTIVDIAKKEQKTS